MFPIDSPKTASFGGYGLGLVSPNLGSALRRLVAGIGERRAPSHPIRTAAAAGSIVVALIAAVTVTLPVSRGVSYTGAAAAAVISGDPNGSQSHAVQSTASTAAATATTPVFTGQVGIESLKAIGTNAAWAEMVLAFGGWPRTQENITVILRWMRQENGVDNWWNRNNPLNNGWGTIEGTYLSGYATLVDAAEQAADALQSRSGYAGIVAALAAASTADATAQAIWASDWATGHYNYGAHWSTAEVEIVQAPADAWG